MYNQGLSPMTRDLGDTEVMMPVHTKGMHVTCHHKMSLHKMSFAPAIILSTLAAPVEQG